MNNTGKKAAKVRVTLQQEFYDKETTKVMLNPKKWEQDFTRDKAYSIIAKEKKNWEYLPHRVCFCLEGPKIMF